MADQWYQSKEAVLKGKIARKYKKLEPILKNMAVKRRVLDIGCNGGVVSMLSAKYKAAKVVGIDKRVHAIQQANMGVDSWVKKGLLKHGKNISFINRDLNDNLELLDQANFIIMIRVIYHLNNNIITILDRIKDREDMIMLIQGNPARREKAALETRKYGNKLALSPAISSLLNSYNFSTVILPDEIVIAKHKNSKFDLSKI